MQINYKPIGDFIKLADKRNKDLTVDLLPNFWKKTTGLPSHCLPFLKMKSVNRYMETCLMSPLFWKH